MPDLSLLISGNAYKAFISEIAKHLEWVRENFFDDTFPDDETVYEASHRFHTIKGGAGFFNLTSIADTAAILETLLTNREINLYDEFDYIKDLITELDHHAQGLPRPR